MITRYVIPLLALLGLVFAVAVVAQGARPEPQAAPVAEPSEPAFGSYVAGAGLIEARSENIRLGTPVSGLVKSVAAHVGDGVHAGDVLFELDDRELQAELGVRRAQADAARAHLDLLAAMPRPEDVPPAQANPSLEIVFVVTTSPTAMAASARGNCSCDASEPIEAAVEWASAKPPTTTPASAQVGPNDLCSQATRSITNTNAPAKSRAVRRRKARPEGGGGAALFLAATSMRAP